MLVYGDVDTTHDAAALQVSIVDTLRQQRSAAPGLGRHAQLVSAFIGAGDLIGGLLDREASDNGMYGMDALTALARCIDASWRSNFRLPGDLDRAAGLFATLRVAGDVRTKAAEGYAFYALYPESYAEAARRSGLPPNTRVIGIRSIGTTLSAMVAAALDAAPPVTVRPTGHPFDRRLELPPRQAPAILCDDPPAFAVVDEGPGLSGSSFGAVVDWLRANGVPAARIHLFPSHLNGPGAEAGPHRRAQWQATTKHVVAFDDLLLRGRLQRWVAGVVGPLIGPLHDLSGGSWREIAGVDAPVAPAWEKRKFLADTGDARWLVKFAGLGAIADRKLDLARRLQAAGLGPDVAGLCHGFLVQRWLDAPNLATAPLREADLVPQLAAYLRFRSTLTAPDHAGACAGRLREMAIYNAGQALGDAAASAMSAQLDHSGASDLPRVHIDARLHRWEWLVRDGRLLKLDALDHGNAHDFVGAQPITWDIAGAIVEHDLSAQGADALIALLAAGGNGVVTTRSLAFHRGCYLAFQLGAWTMSNGADAAITGRYREKLRAFLNAS